MKRLKHMSTWALVALLALTVTTVVGCGTKAQTKTATPVQGPTDEKTLRTVFASALIAESEMDDQFVQETGLANGKDTTWYAQARKEKDALDYLSGQFWDKNLAKQQYESLLGSPALVKQANAELLAKNQADKKIDKSTPDFTPISMVADPAKYQHNNLHDAKANFEDAKITEANGQYTILYKGLKYVLVKNGNAYQVIAKSGQLTQ